jgi:hypothetical protein
MEVVETKVARYLFVHAKFYGESAGEWRERRYPRQFNVAHPTARSLGFSATVSLALSNNRHR